MAGGNLARRRAKKVFAAFKALDEDVPEAIVLRNGVEPHIDLSFFYATAIPSGIFEGGMCVLHRDGHVDVFSSVLEEESARRARTGFRLRVPKRRGDEAKTLRRVLDGRAKKAIGVNSPELTYRDFRVLRKYLPKAKFVDASRAILRARMIKDEAEVDAIREACRIASKTANEIPELLRAGITEAEVAAEINYRNQKYGGQGPSFDTISAFGANAAEPHYTALASKLRPRKFALFDFGTRYKRYCSDITRTFFFGRPTPKDRRMYDVVARAQQAAFDVLKPGATGKEVHLAADRVINATEFKGKFIHGLGHGLGLAVHDGGGLSGGSDTVMEPGMVMTVEPGVYLPGYGGVRIEDDVLITPRGFRFLTTARREFETV
ncbi:MAG: aminopeptidase P family protein [Euryarchaeota archaeon]|nr:aminopeptidase P family protein [Euryarchaeota archaeon]